MFWLQCSLTSLLQLLFSFYVKGYAQFYFRFYVWVLGLIAFFFDYACLQAPEWSGGKFSQLSISGIIHGDLRSSRPGGSYGLTCMLDGSEGLFFEFERKKISISEGWFWHRGGDFMEQKRCTVPILLGPLRF